MSYYELSMLHYQYHSMVAVLSCNKIIIISYVGTDQFTAYVVPDSWSVAMVIHIYIRR